MLSLIKNIQLRFLHTTNCSKITISEIILYMQVLQTLRSSYNPGKPNRFFTPAAEKKKIIKIDR